ncbi:MAG: hypothetical protein N4A74_16470 [Carboxylicivirga sp.]|jgi:hypothetical protein|nr:hypothetical protein [Carboxylicivirga sp.]
MNKVFKTKHYTIGGIEIKANFLCPLFDFDPQCGSSGFQIDESTSTNWTFNYHLTKDIQQFDWKFQFKGSEQFEEDLPYKWSVVQINNTNGLFIEFEDHPDISSALSIINANTKQIDVHLNLKHGTKISIDPFIHPLGILTLKVIVHYLGGFVIHASAVSYKNKGYLFSAVSGTGKSTMAGIWQKYGATIINDDRLIIMPDNNGYRVYNTPMPYYRDKNKNIELHKVFLIKQSVENYITKLPTLKGALGLLGNCMQFQYDAEQVQRRLNAIIDISDRCGIYECGFKPDSEIVDLILSEFG